MLNRSLLSVVTTTLFRQRAPDSKILLLGIVPRGKTFAKDSHYVRANQLFAQQADGKTVFYLDAGKDFLEQDDVPVREKLFADGLHPNEAGNNVWGDAMLPVIEKLLPPEKK